MATLLAEYHYLTPEMIVKIFNNKFIDKMTDYAKIPHYRERRLWFLFKKTRQSPEEKLLGNLNQVVCATYPHYNIPWFNENKKRQEFAGMKK